MRRVPLWTIHAAAGAAALAGGAAIGYADLQTSEVVITLIFLFVLNMVLGWAAPRGGWYWPFLSAIGVPLLNWFPEIVGAERNQYLSRTAGSYLLLIAMLLAAGMAGMLFGVIVRRGMHAPAP